jgi:ankyrin repeat protein
MSRHSYELIECETDEHHHNTTPVNLAAELKTCEILDFYLESGADVNKKDSKGQFPLWKTVRNGHYQNTLNILEKGMQKRVFGSSC